ncbi:MAG: C40 family peptidase [Muribaculaceae bacterium]|nr:C40 family peptidase [Muribaculaceae bacterium]
MRKFLNILTIGLIMSASATATAQTAVDGIIENVRKEMAPDKRQTVYDVTAEKKDGRTVVVKGKISDRKIYDSLLTRLNSQRAVSVVDSITLLPDSLWGQVKIAVACMRSAPKYSSEMSTQAIMGMPVRLLEEQNGWWLLQSPDGYLGWVWRGSIARKTPEELSEWRKARRLVVTSYDEHKAYTTPTAISPREVVTDLVSGNIVEGNLDDIRNGRVEITLPDGRKGWADAKAFSTIEDWAAQDFNPEKILDQAYSMEGKSYLWGGTSAKATDCSGLVKVAYLSNGIILRRDASQQALIGEHLRPEDWRDYQAGDLMFFGEKPGGRVTHVAIYDHDGKFVHCAGRVYRSSIDPESPDYVNRIFFGGSRIGGYEGTEGITYARNHPWDF